MSLPRRNLPVLAVASTALIAAGTFMALTPTPPAPSPVESAASSRHWQDTHLHVTRHDQRPWAGPLSSTAGTPQPGAQEAPVAPATSAAPTPKAADRASRPSHTAAATRPTVAAPATPPATPPAPVAPVAPVAPPPSAAAPAAAVGTSGAAMPTGDLPGWHLTMNQDFTQDAALGQFSSVYKGWAGYDGAHDTSGHGTYDSSTTTTVHGGVLDEYLHSQGGSPRVMALTPPTTAHQTYGRYAVRFRSDLISDYKIAWLLWPSSDNWSQGELDFPEADLNSSIEGYAHDVTGSPSRNAWSVSTGASLTSWHTTVIEWSPTGLTYSLDGQAWHTSSTSAIPRDPMDWVLQTETAENGPAPTSASAGHIDIDWVAAWTAA